MRAGVPDGSFCAAADRLFLSLRAIRRCLGVRSLEDHGKQEFRRWPAGPFRARIGDSFRWRAVFDGARAGASAPRPTDKLVP
eukprot:801870-Pyramimonas_sp.AAC.1